MVPGTEEGILTCRCMSGEEVSDSDLGKPGPGAGDGGAVGIDSTLGRWCDDLGVARPLLVGAILAGCSACMQARMQVEGSSSSCSMAIF